ncbi:MAG: hypothetical protein BHV67_05460 [Bacteroidales bacterium 43_36]|nr:MAG: hypothetical protein BHV67_05460 [Bacteroidales bacterium 43_36]
MDTQNINLSNSESVNSDPKSSKVKKVAGKTAKFAGAAGLGVAGTMAANAINADDTMPDDLQPAPPSDNVNVAGHDNEQVEPVDIVDPDSIMIEEIEEIEPNDDGRDSGNPEQVHEVAMTGEIQPVTGDIVPPVKEDVAMVDIDPIDIDIIDDIVCSGELEDIDVGLGIEDNPENALLADNYDCEPDIFDDLINV